jgi:aryl-alcohol dehydrogenase-like predicted oxidoreductase
MAKQKDATKAQIALAWLLAQKPYLAPIPDFLSDRNDCRSITSVRMSYSAKIQRQDVQIFETFGCLMK